jgi:hypothetical protein
VKRWRVALDELAKGETPETAPIRALVGGEFTRGHYVRAV